MSANGPQAHDILLGFEPLSRHGACWYYVWQAYAQAGASTSMGSSPTAYDGWNLSSGKHPGDMNPPPGAAIWLGRRYDGNMDGDVFIAGAYDGDHAATDQPAYGSTGTTSIEARMNLCGREYLGWTDHVLDCPIDMGGTPPAPTRRTDNMEILMTVPNGTVVHLAGPVKYNFTSIEDYYRWRDDIELFRSHGCIDAMGLPGDLADVVQVDWDTYTRICSYFGAPTD